MRFRLILMIFLVSMSLVHIPADSSIHSQTYFSNIDRSHVVNQQFTRNSPSFISSSIENEVIHSKFISGGEEIGIDAVTISSPPDVELGLGQDPYPITWDMSITTSGNKKYDIYLNGSLVDSGQWTSGGTITYNFVPDQLGLSNVTVVATANEGSATDTVFVTVTDNLRLIKEPNSELTFSVDSDQSILEWIIFDNNPKDYTIFRNSTFVTSSGWLSEYPIRYNMAGLGIGIYNVTLLAEDMDGNRLNDTVIVQITAGPVLVDQTTSSVFDNETLTKTYYWVFEDSNPDSYEIYNDSQLIEVGTWSSGQQLNVTFDSTILTSYNFSIRVNDTANQIAWSNVSLTITDRPEILEQPLDVIEIDETTTIILTWTAEDLFNDSYFIKINDTVVRSLTPWNNFASVNYTISNFTLGNYHLEITFIDEHGLSRTDEVLIKVLDTDKPVILQAPDNQSISYTQDNLNFTYIVEDRNPDGYQIYQNSVLVDEGTWMDEIKFFPGLLLLGNYNITAIFWDEVDLVEVTMFNLTIVDDKVPELISSLEDTIIQVNSAFQLSWVFTDLEPANYVITSNQTSGILRQDNWANGITIDYAISTSIIHIVEYTINVTDLSGNLFSDSVVVNIIPIETNRPTLITSDQTFAGDPRNYQGNWTDSQNTGVSLGIIEGVLRDGSDTLSSFLDNTDQTGYFVWTLDHDGIDPGSYTWVIEFSKFQHVNWTIELQIDVAWHEIEVQISHPSELRQGESFEMTISIDYDDKFLGLMPMQFQYENGPAAGISFEFNFTLGYLNGRNQHYSNVYITDINGEVDILISGRETEDLEAISQVSLSLDSSLELFVERDLLNLSIDPRIRASNLINGFRLVFGFHPIILVIVLIVMFFKPLTIFSQDLYYKLLSLFGRWKYRELYELSLIQSFLIFNNNGILYYSKQFDPQRGIDPSLVAGLSSAITAFMGELDRTGRSGFHRMDKQDLSILIHSKENSSIALLSNEEVGDEVKSIIVGIHDDISKEFEKHFKIGIGNFSDEEDKKVREILQSHDFPVKLMSSVTFDLKQIRETIQSSEFPRFYRNQIRVVLNKLSTTYHGVNMSFNTLVDLCIAKGLPAEIAAKSIYELYLHGGLY